MKPAIIIAFLITYFYIISSLTGHVADRFYVPGDQVHTEHKVDFYQLPNAAYMFFTGGPLGGEFPPGSPQYPAGTQNMPNPYHPVFTIAIGGMLQMLPPEVSYWAWFVINVLLWTGTGLYLFKRFGKRQYFSLAVLMFLGNSLLYLNLRNGQYHILLTVLILYFLIETVEKKWPKKSAYLYFTSLLVKPIGILYSIPLWIAGKRKTVLIGGGLFLVLTTLFALSSFMVGRDAGLYYIVNLIARFNTPLAGPPQAFSLDALLRSLSILPYPSTVVKVVLFLGLIMFQSLRKLSLLRMLFLWTAYYLLFYDFVYEYHYLILAPFFFVGILKDAVFRTRLAIGAIAAFLLPTPYVFFHTLGYAIEGNEIGFLVWTSMVLWRVVPLIVLISITIAGYGDSSAPSEQRRSAFRQ